MSAWPLELGLYTDSLPDLGLDAALDIAAEIGATGIEIATGGQSSAPHLRIDELLGDAGRRAFWSAFVTTLREVGYDDVLAIENEDADLTPEAGVREAARFMRSVLDG